MGSAVTPATSQQFPPRTGLVDRRASDGDEAGRRSTAHDVDLAETPRQALHGTTGIVAEANRIYYGQTALRYETTETCVTDRHAQAYLESRLAQALIALRSGNERPRALDACAGSGNVAVKLAARGCDVTACDITPELLAIMERKTRGLTNPPRAVCAELGSFLSDADRSFDLVTISSALHHLEDVEGAVRQLVSILAPGGVFLSIFDPTLSAGHGPLTNLAVKGDYCAFKIRSHPKDALPGLMRKFRRRFRSGTVETTVRNSSGTRRLGASDHVGSAHVDSAHVDSAHASTHVGGPRVDESALNGDTLGATAEFHAECGLDDVWLVDILTDAGLTVLSHDRTVDARYAPTRGILNRFGQPTMFSLLARRPTQDPSGSHNQTAR